MPKQLLDDNTSKCEKQQGIANDKTLNKLCIARSNKSKVWNKHTSHASQDKYLENNIRHTHVIYNQT